MVKSINRTTNLLDRIDIVDAIVAEHNPSMPASDAILVQEQIDIVNHVHQECRDMEEWWLVDAEEWK